MTARIKGTFMLQVSLEGRNSYRVKKALQQLNVGGGGICVAVDMANIELLILEQE